MGGESRTARTRAVRTEVINKKKKTQMGKQNTGVLR